MKIEIIEKTENEIIGERKENAFYARKLNGMTEPVCPMKIKLDGEEIDAWWIAEEDIISIITDAMEEFSAFKLRVKNGSKEKECKALVNCNKIVSVWKEKFNCSSDFLLEYFQLKKDFKKYASVIDDILIPVVGEKLAQGRMIAGYIKGMRDDFNPVTEKHIIQALKEQERQQEIRKEMEKVKSVNF